MSVHSRGPRWHHYCYTQQPTGAKVNRLRCKVGASTNVEHDWLIIGYA